MSDMPTLRNISTWRLSVATCSLLKKAVANTWCQKRAIFSWSGRPVTAIRYIQPNGGPVVAVPSVVAVAEVGIDVGEALGVEQVVHHVVVRAGRQGFQLAAGGAESGPPHQVRGESQIAITHACSPPNGVSGICAAFYITAQPRTIAGARVKSPICGIRTPPSHPVFS